MPITINGTGSITGISAGGLPDASVTADDLASNAVTTAKIADANITAAKLSGAQSGSAPIYAARAWVNFNGTSTVAIRASGNVSSITDNGTGRYRINFTIAFPDASYSLVGSCSEAFWSSSTVIDGTANQTTTYATIFTGGTNNAYADVAIVNVAIFR